MRIERHRLDPRDLNDARSLSWSKIKTQELQLSPSPIALTESVSPYMAKTTGHGVINKLNVQMTHNGTTLSIRLSWPDPDKDDELADLDQFSDAIAVMFPLVEGASAFSMGSADKPVNAWFWKADESEPYDVLAKGYATSRKRPANLSDLTANSYYSDGGWVVVLQRPLLSNDEELVSLKPGNESAIAFAVWEGSNAERSAQKAVSGEFMELAIDG